MLLCILPRDIQNTIADKLSIYDLRKYHDLYLQYDIEFLDIPYFKCRSEWELNLDPSELDDNLILPNEDDSYEILTPFDRYLRLAAFNDGPVGPGSEKFLPLINIFSRVVIAGDLNTLLYITELPESQNYLRSTHNRIIVKSLLTRMIPEVKILKRNDIFIIIRN